MNILSYDENGMEYFDYRMLNKIYGIDSVIRIYTLNNEEMKHFYAKKSCYYSYLPQKIFTPYTPSTITILGKLDGIGPFSPTNIMDKMPLPTLPDIIGIVGGNKCIGQNPVKRTQKQQKKTFIKICFHSLQIRIINL